MSLQDPGERPDCGGRRDQLGGSHPKLCRLRTQEHLRNCQVRGVFSNLALIGPVVSQFSVQATVIRLGLCSRMVSVYYWEDETGRMPLLRLFARHSLRPGHSLQLHLTSSVLLLADGFILIYLPAARTEMTSPTSRPFI